MALLRQSNKRPPAYSIESEAIETHPKWLPTEQEIPDDEDGDADSNDVDSTSLPSLANIPLTVEHSPTVSLAPETTPMSPSAYNFALDWDLTSLPDLTPTTTPSLSYIPFDDILGLNLNHVSESGPFVPEFPTPSLPSLLTGPENTSTSQSSDRVRCGETLDQDPSQPPEGILSNIATRMSQMILTIDNPNTQTMTSIFEILAKEKCKATISMNP